MKVSVRMQGAGLISLITLLVCTSAIVVSELIGYYWLVVINSTIYISFDNRLAQALAFGVLAGVTLSLLIILALSRSALFPRLPVMIFASICAIVIVCSWSFLVLSHAENLIYPYWIVADVLVFLVILAALLPWHRRRLTRRSMLVGLILATAMSLSLTVPGYLSAQRTALWAGSLGCAVNSCPIGLADNTSPGPPWGRLVQGRVYDFYFDVLQGRVEIMLTSMPGSANTIYWNVGGEQGLSHWNGIGVDQFEWSPATTGFYQLVFLNQNYPSSSLILTRVTST